MDDSRGDVATGLGDHFKELFRRHASSVCVVTLLDHGKPVGFTASSVISVSVDPCLVAFSVMRTSSSAAAVAEAERVGIHFLTRDMSSTAAAFARQGIDRFEGVPWEERAGVPRLIGVESVAVGRIWQRYDAGGSTIVVVEVEDVRVDGGHSPLVYANRGYLGVTPEVEHAGARHA